MPGQMTREQMNDYVNSLPLLHLNVSGKKIYVRADKENGKIYGLDDELKWEGKEATFDPEKLQAMLARKDKKESEETLAAKNEAAVNEPDNDKKDEKKNKPKNKEEKVRRFDISNISRNKGTFFGIVGGFIAVILMIIFLPRLASGGNPSPAPIVTDPAHGEVSENHVAETEYDVLFAKNDILPGAQFSDENVVTMKVSSSVFASIPKAYRAAEQESVYEMYATAYIPYGAPITWDNSGVSQYDLVSPYLQLSAGMDVLAIPVNADKFDLDALAFGDYVDIEIEKYTRQNTSQDNPVSETPAGMTHSSSVTSQIQTDYYTLNHFQVVDLRNSEGSSVYAPIYMMASVPYPSRERALSAILPNMESAVQVNHVAYLCIAVTREQKYAIGDLQLESSKLTINSITPTSTVSDKFTRTSYIAACRQMMDYRDKLLNGEVGGNND